MNNEQLTDLKCRDCKRCRPIGWWEETSCEITGIPVNPDSPACISIDKKEISE